MGMQKGNMKLHGIQQSAYRHSAKRISLRGFWPVAPQQQAKSPSAAHSSIAACGVVKAAMHGQTYKLPDKLPDKNTVGLGSSLSLWAVTYG